jgi:hypothetical protein
MRSNGTPTGGASPGAIIIFPAATFDTHAAYNASQGSYYCPVAGYYRISATINATNAVSVTCAKNAVTQFLLGYTLSGFSTGSGIVQANAGDYIDLRVSGSLGVQSTSQLSIERISGPSAIAAAETVSGWYGGGSQAWVSGSGAATAIFTTKVDDSHGSTYNTSTGVWTCPVSGRYEFNYQLSAGSVAASSDAGSFQLSINKNGAGEYGTVAVQACTTAARAYYVNSRFILNLVAGDLVRVVGECGLGATFTMVNNTGYSFIQWKRIGNG